MGPPASDSQSPLGLREFTLGFCSRVTASLLSCPYQILVHSPGGSTCHAKPRGLEATVHFPTWSYFLLGDGCYEQRKVKPEISTLD